MNTPHADTDFQKLVLQHYDELPPQQKLIADYLLEHLRELPFLSVPELSERCGASEATVVRFAQRLGYDGFSGLKAALSETLRHKVVRSAGLPAAAEALARTPKHDTLVAVAHNEIANIQKSIEDLDREAFQHAAVGLFKADHIYAYGLGISAYLADLFIYLVTQLGMRGTTLSTRHSSPLEQLGPLRPADLLVLFSFPPYSRQTVDVAAHLAERGIPTIAICDRLTAPVAKTARFVLPVRTDNMMFTNSFAAASVLLNALTTEVALRNRDQAADAVARITRILEDDDNLVRNA